MPKEFLQSSLNRGNKSKKKKDFKPAKHCTYETMGLVSTPKNPITRPCGFRSDGTIRKVKDSCLLARMRSLAMIKNENPKLAVCITMYNEDENLLMHTLGGVMQNYNAMYKDQDLVFRQKDMVVVLVCDGYGALTNTFKEFCFKRKLFDEK